MNEKWLKKGAVTLTVGLLALGSVVAYAQNNMIPPANAPAADLAFNGHDGGRGGFGRGGALELIAEQLGIEPADLLAELQAGKTIAQLAEENGVSTDDIVAAVVAVRQEWINSAVEAGNLTQAQADARLALAQADAEALLDKTFTFDGRGPGMGGFGAGEGILAIVAEQLGIEPADLMTELQAGKTIAELAEEHRVATDDIVTAILAAQQERLDTAVAEGRLTQEQADARAELAVTHIEGLLDQPLTGRGPGMGGFGGPGRPGRDGWHGGGHGPFGHGGPGGYPGGQSDGPVLPDVTPEVTVTPNV